MSVICLMPTVEEHHGDDHDGTQESPRYLDVDACGARVMVSVTSGGEAGDRLENLELVESWTVECCNGHTLAVGNSEESSIGSWADISENVFVALVGRGLIGVQPD